MIRVILLRSYQHQYKRDPYSVGTILQCAPYLASELIADKIAKLYEGEYPPKEKVKVDLKQLNSK